MLTKSTHLFLVLMALATLNSSVDIPDYLLYENNADRDNTTFNEMESVAELVCEYALNIHGQFPDKKSNADAQHHHAKKVSSTKFTDKPAQYSFTGFLISGHPLPTLCRIYFANYKGDILSPPPQLG